MILAIAILTAMSCGTNGNPYAGETGPMDSAAVLDAYADWYCSCDNRGDVYGDYCQCVTAGIRYSQMGGQCVIPEMAESCYDWFTSLNCDEPMPPECEPSSLQVPCE